MSFSLKKEMQHSTFVNKRHYIALSGSHLGGAFLSQVCDYWFKKMKYRVFFKYMQVTPRLLERHEDFELTQSSLPKKDRKKSPFAPSDTWTEELMCTYRSIKTLLDKIAKRVKSEKRKGLYSDDDLLNNFVIYWVDKEHRT